MAKQTIPQLRAWFSRFKKPTEGQFWDLFDSFFHKDENIPASKVEGLGTIVQEQNEAIDSSLTASSQAIELANQAIQGDLFKKPAEQTSWGSPDNQTAVAHISLADFMNDTPGMYDNVQAVGGIWRPRVIFPQYSNAGGSITLRFQLNRIVPSAKLQLLDRCVITSNISDLLRGEINFSMAEIIESARIRKSVDVEGQTAFLIFKDYTETTRLHDKFYMAVYNDIFQHEQLRGTYDANVDSYHNLEVPGWYLIGKTYASMGGITGGAVSYNASQQTPGQFSFYAPNSVGTDVYDSIFGVPNSYVEAIWISDNGDGNYYLNVTWRHIKHLTNESWTMLAINSINIYLPKL